MIISCLSLPSCSEKAEKYTTYSFDYFDTVTTIVGYAKDKESFDIIASDILRELEEYLQRVFRTALQTIHNCVDKLVWSTVSNSCL